MIKNNSKPNVIILTHSYPRFKGDWRSNFIESLAVAYKEKTASISVLVPYANQWNRNKQNANGIKLITYRYMPFKSWHILGYGNSLAGDLKFNFLHIFLLPFMIFFGVIKLSILLKKYPVQIIHCHWAFPNSIIALAAKFLTRSDVKIFSSFPGSDVTVISKSGLIGKVIAKIINKSDYLSCNSSDLSEDLVKVGINKNKIDYVIYGVDSQKMTFDQSARRVIRKDLKVGSQEFMLLMVGRFVQKKGFITAIKAMLLIRRKYSKVKLFIIGSGILKRNYLDEIKKAELTEHVIILGEVLPEKLKEYYSACDILLMPSEREPSDGLNVVVVEAMSCGRPIVASSAGGNDLVVFDGFNGKIHKPGDIKDLAFKLIDLIKHKSRLVKMGRNSRRLVEDRFNWDAISSYYLSRYYEIKTRGKAKSQN